MTGRATQTPNATLATYKTRRHGEGVEGMTHLECWLEGNECRARRQSWAAVEAQRLQSSDLP